MINELQITKGYEDFVFSSDGRATVGIAAIGAAAMGQFSNSTILSNSSAGAEISMEYFACLIDEKRVVGKFHKVGFKSGDYIEFVVSQSSDVFVALAARNPEQRLIWMLPYHERGEMAHRRSNVRWTWILSVGAGSGVTLFAWWNLPHQPDAPLWVFPTIFFGITSICLAVNIFARSFFKRYGSAATPILEALGFDNPAEVDLYKIDRAAQKKIKQTTGKSPPLTSSWTFRY